MSSGKVSINRGIKAIIFDFDGVLVESNAEKNNAFRDLFFEYPNYEKSMWQYHLENISVPRMEKFEYYVYNLMDQPGKHELVQEMAGRFSELVMRRVVVCEDVPGSREFVERQSMNIPLYISSLTPQTELSGIVNSRDLSGYFVNVFGDPPCSKLEAIHRVMTEQEIHPFEIVFIGDSFSDYEAAQQTGVRFIGRDSDGTLQDLNIRLGVDMYEIAAVFEAMND